MDGGSEDLTCFGGLIGSNRAQNGFLKRKDAQPSINDLGSVAPFVTSLVVPDCRLSLLPTWDAGAYPFVFQSIPEPVGIIATIPEQPIYLWQAANESTCTDVIADLSGSCKEVQRSPLTVADGVQPCVHAALGSTDQTATSPFFTARLDAVRWALRYVASIITVASSQCPAAKPAMIRAKMPLSLHRFQRL